VHYVGNLKKVFTMMHGQKNNQNIVQFIFLFFLQ